jgi:hypothetical protein
LKKSGCGKKGGSPSVGIVSALEGRYSTSRSGYFPCYSPAETRGEVAVDIGGTFPPGRSERFPHIVFPPTLDQRTDRLERYSPVEQAQLSGNRIVKGQFRSGRELFHALAAVHHCGPGKSDEYRLREMGVPEHELALWQRGQFDLD